MVCAACVCISIKVCMRVQRVHPKSALCGYSEIRITTTVDCVCVCVKSRHKILTLLIAIPLDRSHSSAQLHQHWNKTELA